jgi:outer membrane protein OmpU
MKKILLTTSALTLLAGAAAADVNLSGYGRIGISTTGGASSQYTRMNLDFSGSSTTDGGLTLTAKTRYRTTGSATGLFSGPQASISNGAMSLTVGNAAGAVAQTAGVWGCGAVMWGCSDLTDDRWGNNWVTRTSKGAGENIIRLDMALGGASLSVSGGNENDAELAVSMPMGGGSVGIGYDTGSIVPAVAARVAVNAVAAVDEVIANGIVTTPAAPAAAAQAAIAGSAAVAKKPITQLNYSGSMGDLSVGVKIAQWNGVNAYMASVSAPAGAGSVYVYAGRQLDTSDNYGLRYNQSLGGGASMHVGAASNAGTTTVGAGVHFGF